MTTCAQTPKELPGGRTERGGGRESVSLMGYRGFSRFRCTTIPIG
jgi:hypothetical protein